MDKLIFNPFDAQNNFKETKGQIEKRLEKYGINKNLPSGKWFWITIMICFGVYAAHLSWKCSGYKHSKIYWRILSASIAATFNVFYVIYYFVARSDLCHIIKRIDKLAPK